MNGTNSKNCLRRIIAIRYGQFLLLFFTILLLYSHRTALSVAIIAMTAETSPNSTIPTYPNWTNSDTILSSFFWGYIVTQVAAGQLGEYFGPKWFLCGAVVISSLFNTLLPTMASVSGSTGVMVSRCIEGLSQGFVFPSVQILISRWCPVYERSTVSAFIYSGSAVGIFSSMIISGVFSSSKWGWPFIFYFYGGIGIIWSLVLSVFVSNSPTIHRGITEEEKMYIENNNSVSNKEEKIPTPWKSIFTSLPLWAIVVTSLGQSWGSFTLLTEMPSYATFYMNYGVLYITITTAFPYILMFIVCLCGGPIADKLISKNIITISTTRKLFNTLGTVLPAMLLFSLGFVDKSQKILAIVLIILAVGTTGVNHATTTANIIDLAPNHAGTLHGIINTCANIASILGPLCVGFFGNDKTDPVLWKKVFWLAAALYAISGIFYFVFSSGEVQIWNDLSQKEEEEVEYEKTKKRTT